MANTEDKYREQIEIERLWIATEQGQYVFVALLLLSLLLMFGLWDMASHALLLAWFAVLTVINFIRWMILRYYYRHKVVLAGNIKQVKRFFIVSATMIGLCWGGAAVLFLQPNNAANVVILTITLNIEIIGAILTWFCYLPAAIAILIPTALPLIVLLIQESGKAYIATSLILFLLALLSIKSSLNIAKMLNHALRLNFENAALRIESEEKSLLLETALENMNQGISLSDQEDRLRMWNNKFTDLLGERAKAKVEENANLSSLLNEASPPMLLTLDGSTEYHLPDGQVYEIHQAQLSHGGRVLTYTNISERIKREQALEKANISKTRFLAAASHDLRQPIHALGLFFDDLSDQVYSPETAQVIDQIEDSITAISSMLSALLDISKLDAGVVKPKFDAVPLGELFARLQKEFTPIASENGNRLHIRATKLAVTSDPAMLERMLRNLIGNALRYTENGRVIVAARKHGKSIHIQVLDNGSGIPEDQLDEIFVEFHQLQNPARDRRQGLGLGLSIVKRLCQLMQHEINVSSILGKGSCFSLTLPIANFKPDLSVIASIEAKDFLHDNLAGCRVLVLEDDAAVLEGMNVLLKRWGCSVKTAASLHEAKAVLDKNKEKLDLLIVDYRLSGNVSGIDAVNSIQQCLNYPIAVLIITGDTAPDRLQEAEDSGFPLMHKPVQPAKLRNTLRYLLEQKDRI